MSGAGLQWRDNAAARDGCVTIRQYAGPGPGLGPGPDTYTGDTDGIQTLLNMRTNLGHN